MELNPVQVIGSFLWVGSLAVLLARLSYTSWYKTQPEPDHPVEASRVQLIIPLAMAALAIGLALVRTAWIERILLTILAILNFAQALLILRTIQR